MVTLREGEPEIFAMKTLHISQDLALPLEAVTQTFAILAKRGVGKTYTGAVLVEEMLAAKQQVVVADPIGVWWGLRSQADGKSAGFSIVVFGGEHADVPLDENAGEVIAGAIVEHGFSAILDLSLLRKAAQVRFMTAFAEALYRLNRKPLHFVVDEADAFAPQRPMPGEQRLLGAFEDIVRRGRARGLGVTLITQRAAVLNKNVLTQIEVLVILRTISPQDREAIEAWTEIHGTKKQLEQLSESMASLPIGNAWFWSPGWLDIFKRVQVRKRITFDSSSTPKVGEKVVVPKEIAPVDLATLGEQIKATAERAKENDPAQLKRRITDLEKQVRTATAKPSGPPPAPKIERVLVVESRDLEAIAAVDGRVIKLTNELDGLSSGLREIIKRLQGIKSATIAIPSHREPPRMVISQRQNPKSWTKPITNGDTSLPVGERKILTACAQFDGVAKEDLTVLTGFKRSTRDAYIQRLREKGFVEDSNGIVTATGEGIDALGHYDPLPVGDDLRDYWLARLPEGERRILEILVAQYPNFISREDLEEPTGFKRSTRDAYLQRMKPKRIVEFGNGTVRASEKLFS